MNHTRKTFQLAQVLVREFSKSANRNTQEVVSPKFKKLKETQKKFAMADDVPVHLKGGRGDKLLYQATILITFVGLGFSAETLYRLAVK